MRKLGQRLRAGWARRNPVSGQSLESVREVIRAKFDAELPPPTDGRTYIKCPECHEWIFEENLMWISGSLRGDPLLGPDAALRFHATQFDKTGSGLDAQGSRCLDVACPLCHAQLPRTWAWAEMNRRLGPQPKPANIKPRNTKKP